MDALESRKQRHFFPAHPMPQQREGSNPTSEAQARRQSPHQSLEQGEPRATVEGAEPRGLPGGSGPRLEARSQSSPTGRHPKGLKGRTKGNSQPLQLG